MSPSTPLNPAPPELMDLRKQRELQARGFIYKSSYAGWYAVSDEAYYSETQVVESVDASGAKQMVSFIPGCSIAKPLLSMPTVKVSIETGTKVEWMAEDNYKFRLSAFREPLLKWLSASPNGLFSVQFWCIDIRAHVDVSFPVLQPPSRTAALLAAIVVEDAPDLQDLSISRPSSRLSWGIRVPDDDEHTIYVWIDALVNYLTASGYPWKGGEAFAEGQVWPPELMIVGKDIIRYAYFNRRIAPMAGLELIRGFFFSRFHALYLPAILMALDLPLPRTILAHGHWTMDKFKMSKSRGNVANPFDAMKTWGVDSMRAYLMRSGGNAASDSGKPLLLSSSMQLGRG